VSCLVVSAALASSDGAAVSHLMLPNPPPNTRPVGVVLLAERLLLPRGQACVEL